MILKFYILIMGIVALCFSKKFSEMIYNTWLTKFGIKTPKAFSCIMFIFVGLSFIVFSLLALLGIIGD